MFIELKDICFQGKRYQDQGRVGVGIGIEYCKIALKEG